MLATSVQQTQMMIMMFLRVPFSAFSWSLVGFRVTWTHVSSMNVVCSAIMETGPCAKTAEDQLKINAILHVDSIWWMLFSTGEPLLLASKQQLLSETKTGPDRKWSSPEVGFHFLSSKWSQRGAGRGLCVNELISKHLFQIFRSLRNADQWENKTGEGKINSCD